MSNLVPLAVVVVAILKAPHVPGGNPIPLDNSMGVRQQLNLKSYLDNNLAGSQPENCSLEQIDTMLYTMLAGDTTQQQHVINTLANISATCENWLGFLPSNHKNVDLSVPACHVLRLYQKVYKALPQSTVMAMGTALVNMVNSQSWGSYYPYLARFQDNTTEIDNSENHDMNKKSQQSLAIEILSTLPAPQFGPDLKLADGYTVGQHLQGWRSYWRTYFRTLALHGIGIETGSPVYSKCFLEGLDLLA